MFRTATLLTCMLSIVPAASAQESVEQETSKDPVLRAIVDELERGKAGLTLTGLERPYFIEYAMSDAITSNVSAQLGSVTNRGSNRSRRLRTEIRVGSYELDNTNYSSGFEGFSFGMGDFFGAGASIPIEDDYTAIRQGIWFATDRGYKRVAETFAKKKAFMEGKVIEEKPNDFSHETAVTSFEPRATLSIDEDQLARVAVELSGLLKSFPALKSSTVSVNSGAENEYLVNSEGTRLRTASTNCSLSVSATVQSDDGMELSDSLSINVRRIADLPSVEELVKKTRSMIEQLIAVKSAPRLTSYTGPVLLEAKAAASIFSNNFAARFAGGQRPLGSSTAADDFSNKLGKRILPRFMSVVDDPTKREIAGIQAMGHYKFDDQGVPATAVQLVENGKLKALVMSRNPSKESAKSTGHGRGAYGPKSSTANLIVTATPSFGAKELRDDLLEACQDEDLPFGIRIAAMSQARSMDFGDFDFSDIGFEGFSSFGGRGGGETPLEMYRVYPDGHEELVRGAEIAHIDLKAFKRIIAAGDSPFVLNAGGRDGRTVAVPALLFDELDLGKIDRDFDKPPGIPSPLVQARGN